MKTCPLTGIISQVRSSQEEPFAMTQPDPTFLFHRGNLRPAMDVSPLDPNLNFVAGSLPPARLCFSQSKLSELEKRKHRNEAMQKPKGTKSGSREMTEKEQADEMDCECGHNVGETDTVCLHWAWSHQQRFSPYLGQLCLL